MVIDNIPLADVNWRTAYRIIPSRFPPVDLLERVANNDEFDAIYEIELLTNPRVRDELGDICLVAREERVFGSGSSFIMAAFTHLPLYGSRFTDGSFGVYYAANSLNTAKIETIYHREKFLRDFNSPKIELDMRVLIAELKAKMHTIIGMQNKLDAIYDPNNYTASQNLGKNLRGNGIASWGIHYNSVRDLNGECVAVFRPKALSNCRQERHLCYVWDGTKISNVYKKELESL